MFLLEVDWGKLSTYEGLFVYECLFFYNPQEGYAEAQARVGENEPSVAGGQLG